MAKYDTGFDRQLKNIHDSLRGATAEEQAQGAEAFRASMRAEIDGMWEQSRFSNESWLLRFLETGPIRIPKLPWWKVAP